MVLNDLWKTLEIFWLSNVAVTVVGPEKVLDVSVTFALPLLVVVVGVMVPNVVVKFTGKPSGIVPELEVSCPWLLCVTSAVIWEREVLFLVT
ncbi:hypothetical protein DSECCO2_423860 [anaerobic digester metagenome]|jgi:hypothetical protein